MEHLMITYRKNKIAFILNLLAAGCVVAMLTASVAAKRNKRPRNWDKTIPIPTVDINIGKICLQEISITNAWPQWTVVPSYLILIHNPIDLNCVFGVSLCRKKVQLIWVNFTRSLDLIRERRELAKTGHTPRVLPNATPYVVILVKKIGLF